LIFNLQTLTMPNFKTFSVILFLLFTIAILNLKAQDKKLIDHSVYDGWNDVKNPVISNNGQYISFEVNPQKGDGKLILFNSVTQDYDTLSRGVKPVFGPNSNYLVYSIKPQFDTVRKAKLKKVKKDKLPKDSVGIVVLGKEKLIKYPKLKSIVIPEKSGDWIALLLEKPDPVKTENDSTKKEKKQKKAKSKKDKEAGLLVLINPLSGDSVSFEGVTKFVFSKNGNVCAFIRVKNDSIDSVSVMLFDAKSLESKIVFNHAGYAENISVGEQGKQIAFTYSSAVSVSFTSGSGRGAVPK